MSHYEQHAFLVMTASTVCGICGRDRVAHITPYPPPDSGRPQAGDQPSEAEIERMAAMAVEDGIAIDRAFKAIPFQGLRDTMIENLQSALRSHGHDADCPVVHGASVDCVPGTCRAAAPGREGNGPASILDVHGEADRAKAINRQISDQVEKLVEGGSASGSLRRAGDGQIRDRGEALRLISRMLDADRKFRNADPETVQEESAWNEFNEIRGQIVGALLGEQSERGEASEPQQESPVTPKLPVSPEGGPSEKGVI